MNLMPAVIFLAVCIAIALVRVGIGPTVPDRIVGIDTVNTIVVASMVVLGATLRQSVYIDVAIVYALLSFVATLFIARYIQRGRL